MYYVCPHFDFAVRAVGDPEEIKALLRGVEVELCPECKTPLRSSLYLDQELRLHVQHVLRELTPHETYLALLGNGFPEERECVEEIVTRVLEGHTVKKIEAREIPHTHRTVIDSITLEDGTTLFLSGSGWGALVTRIRKPNAYTNAYRTK